MSKIARVKFIRDKEPNIKALTAENKVLDGALYVATDTGTLWMGISSSSLIQIKDNINTNTTYNLTKSGSTITLRGSDGSTFNVTDSNTVYGNATASAAGLMSAADKAKLDGVAAGSNHVAVDAELSTTSTNPVQNKVIKSALDGKSNTGHKHVKADITDFPTSMPASDVPAWAKAATKPSYSKAEVGLGNVDNTADSAKSVKYAASAGSATTAATANALKVTELNTQNLDDTKTVGLYFADGSNGVKNKPTGVDAFGLEVKKTAFGYLVQVLTEGNANAMKTWIRQFKSNAWSAWAHYFDSNHTPTWSQVSNKPSFATVATSGSYNDLSNKPTIPTIPGSLKNPNALTISLNGTSQGAYDGSAVKNINITASSVGAAASSHTHTKAQITDFPTSMPASDVYSWAKQSSKPSYTISEVSGNLPASRISGVIDAAHLPSYVDDAIEGYLNGGKFYTTKSSSGAYSGEIKAEAGKIYVDLSNNKTYRWSGSTYVVISETIALGTTHSTAGYGDESRAAYNHSTSTGNPHKTTKADLGLGSVENKSSATIRGELTSANVTTALGYTPPKTDTNTHYTTNIVAGAKSGTANAATTNGNTHINVTDDNTFRSGVVIKGTGATSVTSDASGNVTVYSTDTNTWRPVQNNLTSTATDQSLSAAQGKALNDKFGSYVPASRTVNGKALSANITLSAGDVGAAPASHSHSYLPLAGGTMTGRISRGGGGGSWISARNNVVVFGTTASSQAYNPIVGQKTYKGAWTVGNLASDERLVFSYDTDTDFEAGNNRSNQTYLPIGNSSQEIITSTTIGSQSVNHANTAGSVAWSNVSGRPSSMPASDVYAWAKASSKPSYSWSEISGRPSIPSVGNGTVTITQNGATKGTFTLNQSGNATIALTDNNTVYTLPAATSSTLGGVKVGSNITNSSGTISLTKANVTAALGYTPPTSDTNTWRPEEVIISSTQPSASTCKLWIKI